MVTHPVVTPSAEAQPGPVARWWERTRTTLKSDLAVHGLAYLGVVLLFAGVFGLIAFSFGDVDRSWRLVALVAAPSAFFLSGWYLGRRGATAVSSALVILGAAVLPIAAVASVTDGATPDITGVALPITQAVLCAVIALGEWAMLRRVPVLRWMVAPTLWLGVGLLLGVTRDPVPSGEAVVRADALQIAGMVAAIAVTLLLARRWPTAELAKATSALALPLAAALTVLEALVAATEGWPAASGVVTAAAGLLIVECTPRIGQWTAPVETAFVVAAGLRLVPEVRPGWIGLVLAVASLTLAEWTGARHTPRGTAHVPLLVALVAAAAATAEPLPGFVAAGVVTAWATWRRLDEPTWLPVRDPDGVLAGVGTVMMTAMAARWTDPAITLFVAAVVVALVATATRLVPALRDDRMCRWWTPAAAAGLVAATIALPWNTSDRTLVVTAVVAALAAWTLAISRLPLAARVWATSLSMLWCLVAIGESTGTTLATEAIVLASLAAIAVLLGALVDHVTTAHLAAIGHVAGIVAVGLGHEPDVVMTTTLIVLAATWWILTVLHEFGRVAHFERVLASLRVDGADDATTASLLAVVETVPVLAATSATTAVVMLQLTVGSAWMLVPVGVAGTVLALATHLPWRRASATTLAWVAAVAATVGVLGPAAADIARWPTITALALALVTMVAIAPRHALFLWSAWAVTGPLAVLLLEAAGMSRRWSDVAFATWGAVLLLGAATFDRVRNGASAPDDWARPPAVLAPFVVGATAAALGGAGGLLAEPEWGWVLLGMAVVTMAVGLLHPMPLLGVPAMAAGLTAGVRLVPWAPDHPWSLALAAAALAGAAWAIPHRDRPALERWDIAPFATAHLAAAMALLSGVAVGSATLPFLIVAATSAATAVVLRAHRVAILYALAAEVLVLATAAHHGPGWVSLACLASGIGLTVAALLRMPHTPNPVRESMLAAGTVFVAAAWAAFTVWRDLSPEAVLVASASISTAVVLVCAIAVRYHLRPLDLFAIWGIAGLAATAGTALLAGQPGVGTSLAEWTFAAVATALAVAAALTAAALHPALRYASALATWGALLLARAAAELGATPTVIAATVIASSAALVALSLHSVRDRSPWIGPWLTFAVAVQAGGTGFLDPARSELVALVLLVVAVQVVAIAITVGERYVLLLAPLFALAAWLVIAADALRGDPNWFTAPIGLVILVEVAMVRWVRRTRPGATYSPDVNGVIVTLELIAMSVMVGPMLTRIVTLELWYAVPAILLGVAITVWGGVTKVRRRAAFGVGSVLLAVTLLIGVPVARAVPNLSGPALWLTIAGMGLVAIVVATMLEQGRSVVRRWAVALDEMTNDWEHLGGADTAPAAPPTGGATSAERSRAGQR